MILFSAMTIRGWEPGPGDPSPIGWVIFAGYLLVAALAWRAGRREAAAGLDPLLWRVLGIVSVLLALNKQLDLHNAITAYGRNLAKSEGWYLQRRPVQLVFVCLVIAGGVAAVLWALRRTGEQWRRHRLTFAGMIVLVAFVAIRAASFHHLDIVFGLELGGFRLHALMELTGIALLAAAALHASRRPAG